MKVVLSGTLQRYAGYQREHTVEGETLGQVLDGLANAHPSLRPVLFDETGAVRSTHALFINGEQVAPVEPERPVANWDELEVITALAGG
jgi:molybdopterin converting factor small subunit